MTRFAWGAHSRLAEWISTIWGAGGVGRVRRVPDGRDGGEAASAGADHRCAEGVADLGEGRRGGDRGGEGRGREGETPQATTQIKL